jgi:hypothetical protein
MSNSTLQDYHLIAYEFKIIFRNNKGWSGHATMIEPKARRFSYFNLP